MRKVIGGKLYDESKSTQIGAFDSPAYKSDFRYYSEALYITKGGRFFLCGEGNAMSPWSETAYGTQGPGSGIRVLSKEEALEWCEAHDVSVNTITKYFDVSEA